MGFTDNFSLVTGSHKLSKVDFEIEVSLTLMFYDDIVHEFGEIMQNKDH